MKGCCVFGRQVQSAVRGSARRRAGDVRQRVWPRLRLVLLCAVGMCLASALSASASIASAPAGSTQAKAVPESFPLSVRDVSAQLVGGRIRASATIVNTGSATVRSTTGALGLIGRAGGNATGVGTFSLSALRAHSSRSVRVTTRPMDDLQVGTGTVRVEFCTDVYSQIRRFSAKTNCASGGALTIPTGALVQRSGPVPNTIVKTRPTGVSASSTAVFRSVSTAAHSVFECRLDGGPWLACKSPRRYTALVDGQHVLTLRAISPSGQA